MKKFTCQEMGGPCEAEFEGETAREIGEMGGKHILEAQDEAHKAMAVQMQTATEEEQKAWWDNFEKQFAEKE